jgi:hypothetical protein
MEGRKGGRATVHYGRMGKCVWQQACSLKWM